jgi:hypothetical protein
LFPWASVALQFTVVVPIANVLPEEGEQLAAMLPSTMSFAEAENVTAAPEAPVASAVIGAGTLTDGGVVSPTVTLKLAGFEVLPWESVAVHVTVVVVMGNVLPEAGEQVAPIVPSTRSLAEAENVTAAPEAPVASAVIGPGTETVGLVVSCTVTVNEALPVLPDESVALQMTVVVPSTNVLPEAGEQLGEMLPSMLSVADAVKPTAAPPGPVASAVIGAGTVTLGGVVSWTVTVNVAVPVSPIESVALQVTVVEPIGKMLPDGGEQVIGIFPSSPSVARRFGQLTFAPVGDVGGTVMSGYGGRTGTSATATGATTSTKAPRTRRPSMRPLRILTPSHPPLQTATGIVAVK